MSRLTTETLETMFVYMGCANIPTQQAMDGAIPLESLTGLSLQEGQAVVETRFDRLELLGPSWEMKSICFGSDDKLRLSTIQNVHWSALSVQLDAVRKTIKRVSPTHGGDFTSTTDAFVNLYYSEIDRFGRFVKFPVKRHRYGSLIVSRKYNPRWLLEFANGSMYVLQSESQDLFKSAGMSFLAPFMCGLAQCIGSYWTVLTKFDSVCPSLTLLTDATGVKEFWKLRDVPEGRRRRQALLHWVDSHWRQTRNDPDVEAYVRKHMRGQCELTQGSLSAKITPSKVDSVEVESAKAVREELRKKKLDRRRRLAGVR